MSSLTVLKRIAQGSILALGVLLLLYILLYFTWEGSGFARLYQARVLPVAIESVEGSDRGVVAEENSVVTWPGPLPSVGDTVLAILDTRERRVSPGELPDFFREPDTFTVRYVHEGEERTAALVATKPDVDLVSRVLVMEIFRFLGSFGFVLVGLWAFSTRPGSPGVWSLVLFSFGLVVLILRSVSPFADTLLPTFQLPGRAWFHANSVYLLLFFPAFWFQLVLLFPNPHEWLRRRPALVLGLNFGLPLLLAVNTALGPVYPTGVEILMVLHVFAAFTLLFHRAAHAETPLEKRQFRLVSVGTILGLGALFLVLILGSITGYLTLLNPFWRATLLTLMYACLFLIPITFAYAFGRYGLLEVEGRIRRNTRYAAITVVFILLFVLAENGAVELGESLVGQESRLPSTAVAIVFALMFSRAHQWVERETERRFFPERQRLRHLLEQFLASTAALPDENSFWAKLRKLLQEGLGIESVKPLLKDGGGEGWVDKDGDPVPLQPGGRLEETLEEESRTVMVDEALAADPPVLSPEETEWLGQDSVSLLVALRRGEELGGALLLTWSNRREHLGAADLRLMASLSDQIALQHENLRLRAAASGAPHPLSSRSEPA